MKQIPLAITPAVEARFDTLLAGPNAEVVQHVRTLMPPSAPVYLWGPTGSGKTHLLAALAERFQVAGERVGWFGPAEPLPWALEEGWALVVVDECDLLDAQQQQAAFALFVEAGSHGVQWAAAGRVPPVDLPLRDDLRTRLGWGHVFGLRALGEDETRAVLRRESDRRGFLLPDEVMDYMLTRQQRDLKHLMTLLDRLDGYAMREKRVLTVPLLRQMLAEESQA
jgi:DnaA family protein